MDVSPKCINSTWVANTIKLRLKDQYIESWYELIQTRDTGYTYRIFKPQLGFEH